MNDRELLELAAKAIGGSYWHDARTFSDYLVIKQGEPVKWNPANDDGDSRRLQVALQISLEFGETKPSVQFPAPYARARKRIPCDDGSGYAQEHDAVEYVLTPSDVERAARYAVLRVAAAAGKAMP